MKEEVNIEVRCLLQKKMTGKSRLLGPRQSDVHCTFFLKPSECDVEFGYVKRQLLRKMTSDSNVTVASLINTSLWVFRLAQ